MNEGAEGLDGQDSAGEGVGAEEGPVDLEDGFPSQGRQAMQEPAVEAEEDAKALGDGPDLSACDTHRQAN